MQKKKNQIIFMKKSNQKLFFLISILIVLILLSSTIIVYFLSLDEDIKDKVFEVTVPLTEFTTKTYAQLKQEGLVEHIEIINDSISPLTTQAVTLEINRIRKKGIEAQMRNWRPNSWKEKPSYYFEAILHDGIWTSHQINNWDTSYVGWEAFRKVDDELETCIIELTIYETEKTGLFGRKTTDIAKESFSVEYCFRTGRWTGDNRLEGGLKGNGYLNGENFEIWFDIHQSDYDGDGIPFWTKVNILGLDPYTDYSNIDLDDDGIPAAWEWKWGFNPCLWEDHANIDISNDGLSNIDKYNLRKYGANPYRQDIYVEVDYMQKGQGFFTNDHVLFEESKQMVMDKFAERDITLHVDDGSMGGGGEYLPFYEKNIASGGGIASEYYKYHFSDGRKGVFRYCVIVHSAGWCHPQDFKIAYDVMGIPDNLKFYTNNFFPPALTPRLQRLGMAVSFMHELGHTLGLRREGSVVSHGGIDNDTQIGRGIENMPLLQRLQKQQEAKRHWENYESCMNYDKFGNYVLDYSEGTNGEHDLDDWSTIDLKFFQRHESVDLRGIQKEV